MPRPHKCRPHSPNLDAHSVRSQKGAAEYRKRGEPEEQNHTKQSASPSTTSPAASMTASTVEEELGDSWMSNSSAELNPSNWRKTKAVVALVVAMERHRPIDRAVWVAFVNLGCWFCSAAAPRIAVLRPRRISKAGSASWESAPKKACKCGQANHPSRCGSTECTAT